MAKANVVRPDGTKMTFEGSPEEVAALLARVEGFSEESSARRSGRRAHSAPSRSRPDQPIRKVKPKGPADYLRDLIRDDFFKSKREIGDVKDKLEEQAHIYPVTTLSPALFRLVKAKELRRIKEEGQWRYVNP
jgi:hypothetical protein